MNIEEILAYTNCPKHYQLIRECNIEQNMYSSIDEKYIKELHRSIYHFFNVMRSKDHSAPVTFKIVKSGWGNRWVGQRKRKDILIPEEDPVRILNRKRERDGTDCLFNLYNHYATMKDDIIAVDLPGKLVMTPKHKISGNIPLITTDKDDKIRITDFRVSDPDDNIQRDIKLTFYSILFRRLFNAVESSIRVYYLDRDKYVDTQRSTKDYSIFVNTYKNVYKGIQSGVYFRSIARKCDKCGYAYFCKGV